MENPPEGFYAPAGAKAAKAVGSNLRMTDISSTQLYSSDNDKYVDPAFVKAERDVRGKFIAVKPGDFLARHLPTECPPLPGVKFAPFTEVHQGRTAETLMYPPLIKALTPFLKTGWSLVDTSNTPDFETTGSLGHAIKPDIAMYSDKQPSNDSKCRACDMETFIEVKNFDSADGFSDEDEDDFEIGSDAAGWTRGQLVMYLNAMQITQFRTHVFGVLMVRDSCRLLRLTRSAIEVTEAFQYDKTTFLQDFIWRLSHTPPEYRGHDLNFQPLSTFLASQHIFAIDPHAPSDSPVWEVAVDNHMFYVTEPFFASFGPLSRGTRCFVALDPETGSNHLLKDVWRLDGYHPEAETYARLKKAQVPNVATVLAAGDVEGPFQTCGTFPEDLKIPASVRRHSHYQIVLDIVGRPITHFDSTYQLTSCLLDALRAHEGAVNIGIHHRDVSPANIVVYERPSGSASGILIDWEFAKYDGDNFPREFDRMGTKEFMAVRLCQESPPPRTVGDDLESFALVFLWIVMKYAASNLTPEDRRAYLDLFQHGSTKELFFTSGTTFLKRCQTASRPLKRVLARIFKKFSHRYTDPEEDSSGESEEKEDLRRFDKHDFLITIISIALEDVVWKRASDKYVKHVSTGLESPAKKRKTNRTVLLEDVAVARGNRISLCSDGRLQDLKEDGGDEAQ